ncbi:MAG: homoserine dehydrogenase, partial [Nitrospirae bacterium]|nr:homoserine dehydrogenase [Nitrospirota bacterium]
MKTMQRDQIKVGLVGFGTVGKGVARILHENAAIIQKRVGLPITLTIVADT